MSYIGATLSVVAGTPATENQVGYEALSFVEIGKIVSIGELGDSHADNTAELLKSGRTDHQNGVADGGEVPVVYEHSASDAGIVIVEAGNGSNTNHSFRIADPDGQVTYFQGIIANNKQRERTAANRKGGSFAMRVNTGLTKV